MTLPGAATNERYPGWWQAVGLLALLLLLQLLFGLVALTAGPGADHPALAGLGALLSGGLVAWYGSRRRGGSLAAAFALKRVSAALLGAVTITIAGLSIVLSEADNALRAVLPPPPWVTDMFERLTSVERHPWGALFAVVIAAPLAEEPVFRGLMLRGFAARYSLRTAVLGSAVLFGVAHLNPWQFVGAAVFGVLAAWWLLGSGSLVPSLWGHALGNGLPLLVKALGVEITGYTTGLSGVVQFQPLWFDVLGVALLGMGLWLTGRAAEMRRSVASSP
jgi:membrane protease YdiL (CAAX protease family)